jgi:hypothetical protein
MILAATFGELLRGIWETEIVSWNGFVVIFLFCVIFASGGR